MFLISEIRKNANRTDVTFVLSFHRSTRNRKKKVWGEVMFYTCLSLCSQGERGWYDVTSCYGQHPLGQHHLLDSTTPWTALLPGQHHPLNSTSPPPQHHPPFRSTSGQYASYWNAFLLKLSFNGKPHYITKTMVGQTGQGHQIPLEQIPASKKKTSKC